VTFEVDQLHLVQDVGEDVEEEALLCPKEGPRVSEEEGEAPAFYFEDPGHGRVELEVPGGGPDSVGSEEGDEVVGGDGVFHHFVFEDVIYAEASCFVHDLAHDVSFLDVEDDG
jgi:hypothetical protein